MITLQDVFAACSQMAAVGACSSFIVTLDEKRFDTIKADLSAQATVVSHFHGPRLRINSSFGPIEFVREYCAGGAKFYVEGQTSLSKRLYGSDRLDPMLTIWEVTAMPSIPGPIGVPATGRPGLANWCQHCGKDPCACMGAMQPPVKGGAPTGGLFSICSQCGNVGAHYCTGKSSPASAGGAVPGRCPLCNVPAIDCTCGSETGFAARATARAAIKAAQRCECGGDKANTGHSTWCPKFS